jgi:hypothetical protein
VLLFDFDLVRCHIFPASDAMLPTLFFDESEGHATPLPAAPSSGGVASPTESSLENSDEVDVETLPRALAAVSEREVLARRRRLEK